MKIKNNHELSVFIAESFSPAKQPENGEKVRLLCRMVPLFFYHIVNNVYSLHERSVMCIPDCVRMSSVPLLICHSTDTDNSQL